MDEWRPCVTVGREAGDHCVVRVLGRLHDGADDYWDGNWLMSSVDLVVGPFRATVPASLRADELATFRDQLSELYQSLAGVAVLDSMEEWLHLAVSVTSSGAVEVTGKARDRLGRANELLFHIEDLDQSDLPGIIEALDEVGTFFPVVGHP
jgi:hypothetical protein